MTFFRTALVTALLLTTSLAYAEDGTLAMIKQAGVIRIGTTGDYKPFSYKGGDGELVGADISMGKALATDLGVKPEFVMTTWKTMLEDFKAGKFDMVLGGITVNPARAEVGDFHFRMSRMANGRSSVARTRTGW